MTLPGEPNRVIGVYPHPEGGYQICLMRNGQKHSEFRRSKNAAENRADYWRSVFGSGSGSNGDMELVPPPSGGKAPREVVAYWEQKLREAAELVMTNNGSKEAIDAAKAVAQLATVGVKIAEATPPGSGGGGEDEDIDVGGADLKKMSKSQLVEMAERLSQGALKKSDD